MFLDKIYIDESEMRFGPFDKDEVFYIEKNPEYISISDGLKIAEYISIDGDKNQIRVVEAKKSAPNPNSNERPDRFKEYIGEIEQKLCNAFDLFLKLMSIKSIPSGLSSIDYRKVRVVFVLVIKNHEDSWLAPVKDFLEYKIKSHLRYKKIWNCTVAVLNERIARAQGLIE